MFEIQVMSLDEFKDRLVIKDPILIKVALERLNVLLAIFSVPFAQSSHRKVISKGIFV